MGVIHKSYVITFLVLNGPPELARLMAPKMHIRSAPLAQSKDSSVKVFVKDKNCAKPVTRYLMLPGFTSFVNLTERLVLRSLTVDVDNHEAVSKYQNLSWLIDLKNAGGGRTGEDLMLDMLKDRLWGFKDFVIVGACDTSKTTSVVAAVNTDKLLNTKQYLDQVKNLIREGAAAYENMDRATALSLYYKASFLTNGVQGSEKRLSNDTGRTLVELEYEICSALAEIFLNLAQSRQISIARAATQRPDLTYGELHDRACGAAQSCLVYLRDTHLGDQEAVDAHPGRRLQKTMYQLGIAFRLIGNVSQAQSYLHWAERIMENNPLIKLELNNIERARQGLPAYYCPDYVSMRKLFDRKITRFTAHCQLESMDVSST